MTLAPAPSLSLAKETTRLLALNYYDVVHSLTEPVFTEFACLATSLLQAPVGRLSLIDATKAHYVASAGRCDLAHQPRPESICTQVMLANRAIICSDLAHLTAHRIPEPASVAALAQGNHYYAGVPLRLPNHAVIGALCVLDQRPRRSSEQAQQMLELLASLVERTLVVHHGCLTSRWLGAEYWQLTQEYIVEALQRVRHRLRRVRTRRSKLRQWSAAKLLPILQQLQQLSRVLAEPLPGFA